MKVLIGVDGSEGSWLAVEQVGRLLSPTKDQIGFYCSPPQVRIRQQADPAMLKRARESLAEAVFDEARKSLAEPFRDQVHTIVGEQAPAHGMLVAAEHWRADLLAVGARGLGPLKKLLVGSVSTSVAHAARLPVYVARQRPDRRADKPLRVLLADDGSPASRHAAEVLGWFTWPPDAVGRVMTVMDSLLVGQVPAWLEQQARDAETEAMAKLWVEQHEAEKAAKYEELRTYCGELPEPFRRSDPLVAEGHAVERILKAAESDESELIVVGARGISAVGRWLIGSTSDKVLSHAPCSVLLVRQTERP